MIYHYDLHIHSVLSPCADCLMTPNNIFNMAMLKGLDIIAITDHNSLKQLKVCNDIAESYNMLFIPGVEVTVEDGMDLLIYFKTIEDAMIFDQLLEKYIKHQSFDENYYGSQEIMDINDDIIANYPYLLIQPTTLTLHTLNELLTPFETFHVLPHIERNDIDISVITKHFRIDAIETKYPEKYTEYHILNNSDAHQITDLLESTKRNELNLPALTIDAFFDYYKHE